MKLGIIGCGVVGGVLYRWLAKNTNHAVARFDPPAKLRDNLEGCEAIFISVPVPAAEGGQDLKILRESVTIAKQYTRNIFIRSTVLPGTNDSLGTVSMPEFLTERQADQDFAEHPVLVGQAPITDHSVDLEEIFPKKTIIRLDNNREAELAKFAHNCFGAMKVTYFNIIEELCQKLGAKYDNVVAASLITGFIEPYHTQVPGPDGKRGYGGKCFPENIDAMIRFLSNPKLDMASAELFFDAIDTLNSKHRWCDNMRTRAIKPNASEKI